MELPHRPKHRSRCTEAQRERCVEVCRIAHVLNDVGDLGGLDGNPIHAVGERDGEKERDRQRAQRHRPSSLRRKGYGEQDADGRRRTLGACAAVRHWRVRLSRASDVHRTCAALCLRSDEEARSARDSVRSERMVIHDSGGSDGVGRPVLVKASVSWPSHPP